MMNLKKVLSTFLFITFCFLPCNGCSKNNKDSLITYKIFYEQDVSTFNYLTTSIYNDYTHISNFVDGLLENDIYGNIVPSIAKSWESKIIDGKQIWYFNLRDDVYWSDYKGNKYALVTANDFVTTIKYVLNYNVKSNNYILASSLIENGLNYYNATLIENYNYEEIIEKIDKLKLNDPNGELNNYIKIKQAFEFCKQNTCSTNFDSVGIKAISDFELQFTLSSPTIYFLSTLTNYPFLPTCEKFIKEIGLNNFGTNKKYLLYNGAYILKDYYHSSKIEYIKNNNYWDKDKVYIDKIIFNKMLNYASSSYTRLAYETGLVDSFYANINDRDGWSKYVIGKDNQGSINNPVGKNTYLIDERTDFTTYHLIFNQNRQNNNYSTLTKNEINIANKALSNTNFRKALVHGLKSDIYSVSFVNEMNSTIIPSTFVYNNSKDYHSYFIEHYAKENNITYEETIAKEKSNSLLFDLDKSSYYLDLALQELSLNKTDLPIKIEFSYFYSQEYTNYDYIRIKEWNNALNGCELNSTNCDYTKVLITYNNTLTTYNDFTYAIQNDEYSLSFLGVYPNYMDPFSYLEPFSSNGELTPYLNHNHGEIIDDYMDIVQRYNKENQIDQRFKLCAELEYKIIFDYALILPLYVKETTDKILISRLLPYQKMKSNYGLSPFKFKLRKMIKKDLTQEDIMKLKEEYEKGKI